LIEAFAVHAHDKTAPGVNWCRVFLSDAGIFVNKACQVFLRSIASRLHAPPPKKKEEPKPDFGGFRLRVLPNDGRPTSPAVKPGHWTAATLRAKANNFTFVGRLSASLADVGGRPLTVERTPFFLASTRPAVLPKGELRFMELDFFVPAGRERSRLDCKLLDRGGGGLIRQESEFLVHMPPYQYYLVVLSRNPDHYRYLKNLYTVRPPGETLTSETPASHYRVLRPRIGRTVPLPAESLAWSSTAYVLWDGVDPGLLRPAQQQAMLDWLYWGGQLIVSGPDSIDALRNSFLNPFLPASSRGSVTWSASDLEDLNRIWSLPNAAGSVAKLLPSRTWTGARLVLHPEATSLPGAEGLVAERQIGRGRIVATAFELTRPELLRWPSFDSFFNGAVMRRSPRGFHNPPTGEVSVWLDTEESQIDPRRVTRLRYFSRDARPSGQVVTSYGSQTTLDEAVGEQGDAYVGAQLQIVAGAGAGQSRKIDRFTSDRNAHHAAWNQNQLPDASSSYVIDTASESGAAGWNDFGSFASEARRSLRNASGIVIPKRDFVFKMLAAYLLLVVPLNWFTFWVLGRVEWAWVAAPLAAVACAMIVVWRAQLDIGFARSSTELAVVELQDGYPRAHVSRYTTLYTSLSTRYGVHFDDPSAVSQPFARGAELADLGRGRSTVEFRRDPHIQLQDFVVASNSMGMLRSEYMLDLGGPIELEDAAEGPQVRNGTTLRLTSAAAVRKVRVDGQDHVQTAWLGDLGPGQVVPLRFTNSAGPISVPRWDALPMTSRHPPEGALGVRRLLDMAASPVELNADDVRLVGCVADEVPGMRIEPAASQTRTAAFITVNLRYGAGTPACPDAGLSTEARDLLKDTEEDEDTIDEEGNINTEKRLDDAEEKAFLGN